MFTHEGSCNAIVNEVMFSNPPDWRKDAGPDDFDICLKLERADDPNQSDWWRGDMSLGYCKLENKTHLRQCDITLEALRSVGFKGDDLTTLEEQLMGRTIPITVKQSKPNKDGKTYMNIFLGSSAPVALTKDEAKRRVAALFGSKADGAATAPVQAQAKPATPPAANAFNPFAKK